MSGNSYKKIRVFVTLYFAYTIAYVARKNYGFWIPSLISKLGKTKAQVGTLGSSFEFIGGVTKVLGGVLVDASNPALLLALSLFSSGVCNLLMCLTDDISIMALLWGGNGLFQVLAQTPSQHFEIIISQ